MNSQRATRLQLQFESDLKLADELSPTALDAYSVNNRQTQKVFITGGTGFLGRFLIRELLESSSNQLICLIRAESQIEAEKRLYAALLSIDVTADMIQGRVQVYCGDIESANFGLDERIYNSLAAEITIVYHAAALVNWVRSYKSLRSANVLGTLEVARFALNTQIKRLVFVSSIAVCYATSLRGDVDESTELSEHVGNMPLGYAQSKAIAECLLQKLTLRGLPINIIRPALIGGDSRTGFSSCTDLIAAVVDGCVTSGLAGDVDWQMDHVAVDYVAKVIACIPSPDSDSFNKNNNILHLRHERPGHWRELVLMLNLYGYDIKLVPMKQWLDKVPGDPACGGTRLYSYRNFFLQSLSDDKNTSIHELYLNPDKQQVNSERSYRWLSKNNLAAPANDAYSVRQAIVHWQQQKVIPTLLHRSELCSLSDTTRAQLRPVVERLIKKTNVTVVDIVPIAFHGYNSIFSELLTIGNEHGRALAAWRVLLEDGESGPVRHFDCIVKSRSHDHSLIHTSIRVAKLCSPTLGDLVARNSLLLNLADGAAREQALYAARIPALRQHTPRFLGTLRTNVNLQGLVLERLDSVQEFAAIPWEMTAVNTVLEGLANIQAIPIKTLNEKLPNGVLKPERSIAHTLAMVPLWRELLQFSERLTTQWQEPLAAQQYSILSTIGDWLTTKHKHAQVLSHNDFNPRNLVVHTVRQTQRLCVYDWELAVIGSPHIDFVEFLVFTLNPNLLNEALVTKLIDDHRSRLQTRGVTCPNNLSWRADFAVALRLFMITRLPWYCLMHRFSPQPHLKLCCQNASRLHAISIDWIN